MRFSMVNVGTFQKQTNFFWNFFSIFGFTLASITLHLAYTKTNQYAERRAPYMDYATD